MFCVTKGFSIPELLISLSFIGAFAILSQGLIITSKTFLASQINQFDSMRLVQSVRDSVCQNNSGFRTANIETKRSFYQAKGTVIPGGTNPDYQNRIYERLDDNASEAFISLDLDGADVGTFKSTEIDPMLNSRKNTPTEHSSYILSGQRRKLQWLTPRLSIQHSR